MGKLITVTDCEMHTVIQKMFLYSDSVTIVVLNLLCPNGTLG